MHKPKPPTNKKGLPAKTGKSNPMLVDGKYVTKPALPSKKR